MSTRLKPFADGPEPILDSQALAAKLRWLSRRSRSTCSTVNQPPVLGPLPLTLAACTSCTNSLDASFISGDPDPAHRINDFTSLPHTAAPVGRTWPRFWNGGVAMQIRPRRHLLRSNLLLPKCTYMLWADLHGRPTSKTQLLLTGAIFRSTF